jgi:ribonuclease E
MADSTEQREPVAVQANAMSASPAPVVVAIPAPAAAVTVAAPKVASAASTGAMPAVSSFDLPLDALQQVAADSGLQWVNSDPARIAAVQTAIAAEPKPVHVPRERPAPAPIDAGPLVLVETKRDLRNMTLPFEETT